LSIPTIANILGTSIDSTIDVISTLVQRGILDIQLDKCGLYTYFLSDKQYQLYIEELARLEWNDKMRLEKRLITNDVSLSKNAIN
jgi:hypothetical protein